MANGTIFNNDTPQDMQELIDILNKMSSKVSSISENSNEQKESFKKNKTGSIGPSPTIADLKSYVGNLGLAVPAGFIMLHNDLEKLSKGGGVAASGGSTLSSLLGAASAGTAGAALGGFAGAAVGSFATGLFSALKPDSAGQKNIEDIIDQMNANLTLEEVSSWPGIKEAQEEGISAYVKTYFTSQSAALITSEVIGSIGEGAGKAIAGLFTGIWKGFGGKEKTGLETITAKLMENLNPDDYINKPEILEAEEKGISAYVKTYFIIQATSLALSETIGAAGEGAGKAIAGLFTGLWKGFGGKEKTGLEGLVNKIIDNLNYETVIQDTDVQEAVHDNFVAYLKTYFATQIASMTLSETVAGITESAGQSVGGVLKGLFNGIGAAFGIDTRGPLQIVADDVIASIKSEDFINDTEVKEVEHKNVVAYLKTYFAMQIANMTEAQAVEGVYEAAGKSVGGVIKGLISGIGEAFSADISTPIQKVINNLIENINVDEYVDDPDVLNAEKQGIVSYLKTYFDIQAKSSSMIDTASAAGEAGAEKVKTFFVSLFTKDTKSPFESAIETIVNDIDVNQFKDSVEIKNAKKYGLEVGVKSTLNALGTSLAQSIDGEKFEKKDVAKLQSNFINAVSNAVGNVSDSINVDIANNSKTIASSFDDTKIRLAMNGISNLVLSISNKMDSLIEKDTTIINSTVNNSIPTAVAVDDLPR